MAKLTDIDIREFLEDGPVGFKTPISVTKEGIFTTTLPKEAVELLDSYGVTLEKNRIGNPGYFEAKTLDELRRKLHDILKDAVSRELIEDKIVIKYEIRTTCNYVRDADGEAVPNGLWVKDHKNFDKDKAKWIEGTHKGTSIDKFPQSFSIWAMPYRKQRYAYKSGREYVIYERFRPKEDSRSDSLVDWLAAQVNTSPYSSGISARFNPEHYPEVDATEENAQLFVTLIKFVWKANELFSQFIKPENILQYLAQHGPLMLTSEK